MTSSETNTSPGRAPGSAGSPPAAHGAAAPGARPVPAPAALPAPETSLSLRFRIWLACVSGALVSALGLWWVAGMFLGPSPDPPQLLGWLAAVGGLGLVIAIGFALWLDHGIVSHLRGLTRGLASGRVQELRGLPSASGWGELSELTEWAQVLITRQRIAQRAGDDLEKLEAALALALGRLEAWRATDRWEPLPAEGGPGSALAGALNETFARAVERDDQNLEAVRRVRAELVGAAGDARESASQAERGFVEATALLTTVRELQRLGLELQAALAAPASAAALQARVPGAPAAGAGADPGNAGARAERYREAVGAALEELIASSNASIAHLSAALRRVQEIAAQVQVVSQRATLVALHAVTLESRLPREERRGEDLSRELRLLTGEVRSAAQNADALAADVERETRAADERMRGLRERVAPRLEPPAAEEPVPAAPAAPAPLPVSVPAAPSAAGPEPATRLLERVREMIQDATRKGERLSAEGERASRTAARLLRRLEDEAAEIEGLMVRLSPTGTLEAGTAGAAEDDEPAADFRLFGGGGAFGAEPLDPSEESPSSPGNDAGQAEDEPGDSDDTRGRGPRAREERP